jgi:oligopeptidase B
MKIIECIITYSLLAGVIFLSGCKPKQTDIMNPPIARKIPFQITTHGQTRIDPYYWMNQRENPEVTDYLHAENAYTLAMLKPVDKLQEELYQEMVGRIKKDDETVPYLMNGYYYQTRYSGSSEYPAYYRWKAAVKPNEELLFDINRMSEGYSYFEDSYFFISPDNHIAAIGIDTVSRRNYTLRFKDLINNRFMPDEIHMTTGQVAWAADSRTLYYTLRDPLTLRSGKIKKHILGTPVNDDKVIFEEKDETFSVSVSNARDQRYILIHCESTMTTEVRILDSSNPEGKFVIIEPRHRGHEYDADPVNGKLFIRSNHKALNFRIMLTDLKTPGMKYWKEMVPHASNVLIEQISAFTDHLVVQERYNGLSRFRVMELSSGKIDLITMEEESYVLAESINAESDTRGFRFVYSSLTTPRSVIEYNFLTGKSSVLKQTEVLGGFDKKNYETRRLFATAYDGTKIPVSIVYRKGMKQDGSHPSLVYAYGSYGYSTDPWFRSTIISLLDRGFVYAIAHVRGGEEMGRGWYEEGKLLKKKNTFSDFINCCEFLTNSKYTATDRMFAMGGSAGGLLMGAISNMRPDLFKGIVAAVPFVDVVTTMLDESIPLTTGEYDEWGNPQEKEYYDYMLSYSPYDNVVKKNYCNILVTAGFHDSQVQYWEPAKWVARLREYNTSDNLILLHTNMDYGHGGASGRFEAYRETALEFAFILMVL